MVTITLTQALVLYSAVLGALILVLWLYTEVTSRRTHRQLRKQNLWRCTICAYTYVDEGARPVSECPRCHSFNRFEEREGKPKDQGTERSAPAVSLDEPQRSNPSRHKRPGQRRRGPRKRR